MAILERSLLGKKVPEVGSQHFLPSLKTESTSGEIKVFLYILARVANKKSQKLLLFLSKTQEKY